MGPEDPSPAGSGSGLGAGRRLCQETGGWGLEASWAELRAAAVLPLDPDFTVEASDTPEGATQVGGRVCVWLSVKGECVLLYPCVLTYVGHMHVP